MEFATSSEMISGTPVELRNATKMYQPVKGTSNGSRYFVVGLHDECKVAARIKPGNDLSIRIEGNLVDSCPTFRKNLESVGFGLQSTHASFHRTGGHPFFCDMSVGAVLAMARLAWDTPIPNMSIIEDLETK